MRIIADRYGLGEIADLPTAPCLASRVETGLPTVARQLRIIDALKREIARRVGPGDVRCRLHVAT